MIAKKDMGSKIKEGLNRLRKVQMLRNAVALVANLAIVYAVYTLCRLVFIWCNPQLYSGMTFGHELELLRAGLIFDSSAIFYTNALIILMFLLPFQWKERRGYYTAARWIYTIVNFIGVTANMCDVIYFRYTGKRTTMSVFNEFSNEGAGNLANVFIDQIVHNWWLLLAGIAMGALLWYAFRNPVKRGTRPTVNPWCYYPLGLVLLGGFSYLTVGMMRGGFTHAVRPITISNANQYAANPAEAGVVLNTPFSMLRTINKKPFVTPDYMPEAEAEAIYSPLHLPTEVAAADTTGLHPSEFRPMNVVILIMESFSKQHIGFFNDLHGENGPEGYKRSFTPFLDNLLANDALSFRYSYANGRKSIEGMPSILSSIPNFVEPFFLTPATLNDLSGIARELSENKGYHSAFFHGAENGSMGFQAFANGTGFQEYYGRTEYNRDPNFNGDKDFDGTWAIYDEEFLQYYAEQMSKMEQPFITSVFTATSHPPFNLPERYKDFFPKGEDPSQETIAYSDNALRLFFERAAKEPWFDNTLFVITADHATIAMDPFYETVSGHFSVPVIFYAPGLPALRGYDAERVVSQSDIMPTLLGLLGYDNPYVAFGQDILNTPAEDKFAIHWAPEFNGYEFIKGDYILYFQENKITHAYLYKEDLLRQTDVLDQMDPELLAEYEKEIKAIVQQYMQCMNTNTLTAKNYMARKETIEKS